MSRERTMKQLRFLAIAEGISYLLFGLTMPIKYYGELLWPNQVVGMVHGVLFIAYCIWVLLVARKFTWSLSKTLLALLASLIPIATFVVEFKWLRVEKKALIEP